MAGMHGDLESRPVTRQRVLTCKECGQCIHCTPEDLLAYMRAGWPKCCRETMTLFIGRKLPTKSNS